MRGVAGATAALLASGVGLVGLTAVPTGAAAAPVGQGFTVTPSDLAFILKQIKIAEAHVANTTSTTGPCGAMLGTGPNQIPNPLLSFGLRTVDGSCNNLQPGREKFGAADQRFPRHATPLFKDAENVAPGFGPAGSTSYRQKTGNVFDSQARTASNLIVDQTSNNPAAVAAAGFPVRTQGNPGVLACTTDPNPLADPPVVAVPSGCTPMNETLFIPNVTTDVGLSPPYNSLFTLFGQFFDHGLDLVGKSGGTVFVPLKADDPLVAGKDHKLGTADDLPANLRFMVLTRASNGPGPDGTIGTADDEQNGVNRDSSFVDQSQTYTSHSSHQVFLREYAMVGGKPVSTGRLLGTADGGMATWKLVKERAATQLGLKLVDMDILNIPMIAADPYGRLIPGPLRGMPQYVTASGLVEGDATTPVAAPADVKRIDTAFLDDIAHNAAPAANKTADTDTVITPATARQPSGTYDDEMLDAHFVAGDGRTNENIGLTAIHQVFHSEHDRLVADIKNTLTNDGSARGVAALAEWKQASGADGWNGERLFQASRFITEMEYQHLVFEEFGRKVQPAIEPFTVYHDDVNPAIKAEFAHAVYRFGHSMLTETISRKSSDPTVADMPLLDGFLNPPAYTQKTVNGPSGALTPEQAAGSIVMGMSDQVGNELDEFVTDTLRSNLLGLPLDLATLNMVRARETGVPSLNNFRKQLFASTNDGQLTPYGSWVDFGLSLKHPESLVNFVAAYGQHPSVLNATTLDAKRAAAKLIVDPAVGADPASIPVDAADFMGSKGGWANTAGSSTTGLDDVDLWTGGLAERTNLFGGLLGSTFNYVFENQMTDLQNGDRFYYLARTPGMNLRAQLEGNSFAEMIMRNTDAHSLKADAFGTADCKFELANLGGTSTTVADDPTSECDEAKLLIRMPDGTIRYRTTNSVDPAGINGQAVYNGTPGVDRIFGGVDNDTFLGNGGNDVIEGGGGADVALGGDGNDIITDLAGDDVPKGGPGNDAIDAGPGLDIVMGGDGKDFTNGGANANETFAGNGDDFVIAGAGTDTVFGDSGNDWIQGGDGQDLLCGDSCAPFFDDPNAPGADVLIGQNGEEDYDAEGGDDIMAAGPGIERNAGAAGYDWSTYQYDPLPADADLNLSLIGVPLPAAVFRDRYQEVEALSGAEKNDVLRGDNVVPSTVAGAGFSGNDVLDAEGAARISGLAALLPANATDGGATWGAGNIILGGPGSDLLEGRGADDIIDGDKQLKVRLSVRTNAADPATEIGTTDLMEKPYLPGSTTTLQQAVFAGTVDPGNIVTVREIVNTPGASDVDVARFSGRAADYDITFGPSAVTVSHTRGTRTDGIDTVRNVETLRFSDGDLALKAPGAPVIGTSTAGNGQVTVTWAAPAVDGSPEISSYEVVVTPSTGSSTTVTGIAPSATSRVVTGLTNGIGYSFQVRALNAAGAGDLSAVSAVVTPEAATPGAPTIGSPTAEVASATVRWDAPVDDGGAPVSGYTVRAFSGTTLERTQPVTGTVASVVVTGLTNGTQYTFDVAAVNAAGTGAPSARSAAVRPRAEFVAPTVTARTPTSGARSAGQAADVMATFSEPVTGLSDTTFVLQLGTTVVPASVSYNATTRTATLNPTVTLTADRVYTATISGVTDLVGNTMATTAWSFTTGPAPTITATSPAAGATAVRRNNNITATFSEVVVGVNPATVRITRVSNGAAVAGTVSLGSGNRVVTINPSATLLTNTRYRVTITGGTTGVRDLAGNPAATRTWTFTTGTRL